jgi:eukaryotic-like serine/threonine-protein kinase
MTATTEAGRTLADGRYRVDRLLGAGGMATVWLAHDERLGRAVAIKEMSPALADDERFVARFRREARIAASLSHPNLVRVFDFAVDGGRPFLVMEHVPGGTLAERLDNGRGVGDCVGLARALLDALAHIHGAGIVHRDLKPANVLVGADDRPRITDFGIAHSLGAGRLTRAGHVIGTARFLAPEVRAGAPSSPASDLYGLGVLLRECTRGAGPAPLERLVARLVAEDPTERPASAEAALGELDCDPDTAPIPVDPRRMRRFTRTSAPVRPGTPHVAPADPPRRTTGAQTVVPDGSRHAPGPRRAALTLLLLVTGAVGLAALATTGDGERGPREAPAAARGGAGSEVDRSLDRIERLVRSAREP